MNKTKKDRLKVQPELVGVGCLSGGLTIVFTLISIALCTLALIFRYDCSSVLLESTKGDQLFLSTIIRTYILDSDCSNTTIALIENDALTSSKFIYALSITILTFAVITFISSIVLISALTNDKFSGYVDAAVIVYVVLCLASLAVDLTLAVHFGIDHEYLKSKLATDELFLEAKYIVDLLRLGSLLLMTVCLKGYIGHVINIILLVVLIVEVIRYQKRQSKYEHSIHKLGIVTAFDDPQRRAEDAWNLPRNDNIFVGYDRPSHLNRFNPENRNHVPIRENPVNHEYSNNNALKKFDDPWKLHRNDMIGGRGKSQINPGFIDDEPPRSPFRGNAFDANRPVNRSDSWLHNQINSGPALGSRPFSYLEEPKRSEPTRPPSNDSQWRRDQWPPVPDPDYSPPPRRLKSALKSNYP